MEYWKTKTTYFLKIGKWSKSFCQRDCKHFSFMVKENRNIEYLFVCATNVFTRFKVANN